MPDPDQTERETWLSKGQTSEKGPAVITKRRRERDTSNDSDDDN